MDPKVRKIIIRKCAELEDENIRDDFEVRLDILMNGNKGYNNMTDEDIADCAKDAFCCECGEDLNEEGTCSNCK